VDFCTLAMGNLLHITFGFLDTRQGLIKELSKKHAKTSER